MRLLTTKELLKIYHLRNRHSKSRIRKKNNKRAVKYMNTFGCITSDLNRYM